MKKVKLFKPQKHRHCWKTVAVETAKNYSHRTILQQCIHCETFRTVKNEN